MSYFKFKLKQSNSHLHLLGSLLKTKIFLADNITTFIKTVIKTSLVQWETDVRSL